MPRGSRITTVERRSWLDDYEQGVRLDEIAKKARRSQRSVKSHIERARQERLQHEVLVDLLRDAYRDHYRELLEVAEALAASSATASTGSIMPAPDLEFRLRYAALRSHAPRSSLWDAVEAWEGSAKNLTKASEGLKGAIAKLTGREITDVPHVLLDGFNGSLWDGVMMAAEGRDPLALGCRTERSGDSFELICGSYILAERVSGETELGEIRERHHTLLRQLLGSERVSQLKALMSRWAGARDIVQEEAARLRLRRILPGQCTLCPGGEGTSVRRPRRRRLDE